MKLRIPLFLISVLAPFALPAVARARVAVSEPEPEPEPERSVALELDVSQLPEDEFTEDLASYAIAHQKDVLARAGVRVSDEAKDVVRLEISRFGDNGVHYRGRLSIVGDAESPREFDCQACTDTEFLQLIEIETALLARGLGEDEAVEVVEEPEPPAEEQAGQDPDEPEARGRRVGGLGWAGVGVTLAGVGAGIGGAVVLLKPPALGLLPENDGAEQLVRQRELGLALSGASVGFLMVGVAMIVVDQTVLRKQRDQRARRLSVLPSFSATGAGISWVHHF